MTAMPRREEFSVELDGAPVRGHVDLPGTAPSSRPHPAVLVCPGPPQLQSESAELHDGITAAFLEAGVAVASLTPAPGRGIVAAVDDASAFLHGLALRDELDIHRLGLLGHSLGAVVAACLSKRTDQIARLALLAPPAPDDLAARFSGTPVPPGWFEGAEGLTPLDDIAAHDRPTLIMHGAADLVVSPERSLAYRDAILAAGHRVEHALVALGDHFFSNTMARRALLDHLSRFFAAPRAHDRAA